MTLYSYWRSSAAYRVRIALNLKGLSYHTEAIHLVKDGGQQHKPQYQHLNPSSLVPTLATPDGVLRQSMAIMEYLDEVAPNPPLLPTDPIHRAQSRALAMDICCETHPLNNLRVQQYLTREYHADADKKLAWMTHWMHLGFLPIEHQIAETGGVFAVGDTPTLADICLIPQVYNAKRFHVPLDKFPRIEEIWSRCNELDAFKSAAPEQQTDADPKLLT
ncbi:maleylacetoacetate isomerase [Corallincola platygyrae]|uniref:Maleylacetoacetate isomerase n=1 Tax=Corallincola platygyrae TaxID=1193278 RepID=A0ABW4XIW7_9GAMM